MLNDYIREAQQTLSLHPDYNKYQDKVCTHHKHSNLSVRDGCNDIESLVRTTADRGFKRFALTDHGTIAGIYDSFKYAEKYNLKAGIGCEFYMVMSNEMEQRNKYHITAIALNDQGYQNMLKLQYLSCLKAGEGQIEGFDGAFYFVPRVTEQYLSHFCNDIMISSGCRLSIINRAFMDGDFVRAYSILEYLKDNIKHFFIELHIANSEVEEQLFWLLKRYAQQNDLPTIIANDSHYTEKDDHISWQLLNAIRHNNSIKDDGIPNADFYIKSYDELLSDTFRCNVKSYYYEIANLINQIQEFFFLDCYITLLNISVQFMANINKFLIDNQDDIFSDTIELFYGFEELDKIEQFDWYGDWNKRNLPMLTYPNADAKLKRVLYDKLLQKFDNKIPDIYIERMKKEWKALQETNNVSYLYVNYLFLEECKANDIMLSTGRGSAAGLLSAYLIGATRVDPIPYNLVMERAMNPDRPKLMDIDLDFATTESKDAIKILKKMFGDDHVCQIINYGYTKVKSAIQSVGRYLQLPPYEMDNLTKQLNIFEEEDEDDSDDITRRKATPLEQLILLKESQYVENLNKNPLQFIVNGNLIKINGDKFCEYVERLIGTINNLSVHASGVLVMNEPVWKYVPVMRVGDILVSAFDMRMLEELHGLKIDVLKVAVMDLVRDGYNYLYDKELLIR